MNLSEQQNEVSLHAVDYWQVIKNRYGIILLTLALVFMTASVITYVMPEKYESTAVIQVKPRGKAFESLDGVSSSRMAMMTPQFFGTEFEIIKSQHVLLLFKISFRLLEFSCVNTALESLFFSFFSF